MNIQNELIAAIEDRNLKSIEYWVRCGANLNKPMTNSGYTPFMLAMLYFQLAEEIETLIELGGDVNQTNKNRETPMMMAVDNGCEEIVPWVMVDYGAEINAQDKWGNTALMRLLKSRNGLPKRGLVFTLVDYGADLTNLKNKRGQTAFDLLWNFIKGFQK